MVGPFYIKEDFLRFLSLAKQNIDIMSTIYEPDGEDVVSVYGIKRSEDNAVIVIDLVLFLFE